MDWLGFTDAMVHCSHAGRKAGRTTITFIERVSPPAPERAATHGDHSPYPEAEGFGNVKFSPELANLCTVQRKSANPTMAMRLFSQPNHPCAKVHRISLEIEPMGIFSRNRITHAITAPIQKFSVV
eukprot:scaffold295167_cov32-Tisochrysis_lutea.AAC.1